VTPAGQPGYVVEHFVKCDADVQRVLSTSPARIRFDLASTRQRLDEVANAGILYVSYPDPMYSVATLFAFEDFVVRCVTDPGPLQELIDHQAIAAEGYVQELAAAAAGLPLLFYTAGPEVATPPMLSPAVFRRFVTPYQKRLIATFHGYGHCVAIHCHGRVRQVLDEILETGADVLEPIEPPDQGDIGLRDLLDRTRGRICLLGHIQDQEFYCDKPGLMRRRVAEIAAAVDPAERYVMAPTCTPFQFPAAPQYVRAYREWLEAAAELLPAPVRGKA
jgi:uroporphyrinogen-III decarboxylase